MVKNLSTNFSLLNNWVSELRNVSVQHDRMRFRRNLERIGEVMAFEISKELSWEEKEITTPLGIHNSKVLAEQPVLATILRAGIPLHNGMLNYFDHAENSFISAYRKHHRDGSFEIQMEYLSSPVMQDKIVIISDPMIATGSSIVKAVNAIKEIGIPRKIYVVCAIASTVGIQYLLREAGKEIDIWCGDIDEEITAKGYIVPGLGDAGDLAYGSKSQA